jgi:AcrR family transcriptional regulator
MRPSQKTPQRTQEQRRSEAEQSLLNAAARLFARNGVEATSLADIGREAGYSRGLANHHFGSRAALVERLAERMQSRFVDAVTPTASGVDQLVIAADTYLDQVRRGSGERRAFFVMWGSSFAEESPLRQVFVQDDARFRSGIEEFVRAGQQAGELRPDADAVAFSVTFVALLRGLCAQYVVAPDAVDLVAAQRICAELIRDQLATGGRRGAQQSARPRRDRPSGTRAAERSRQ